MKSTILAVVVLGLLGAFAFLFLFDPSGPIQDEGGASGVAVQVEPGAAVPAGGASGAPETGTVRSEIDGAGEAGAAANGAARLNFDGPSAIVTARLVNGDGNPAAGAEAEVIRADEDSSNWMPLPPESEDELEWPAIPAGTDGWVRVEVPAGIGLRVEFGGAYWRTQSRGLQPLREGEVADFGEIALTSATRLAGRITGEGGAPLAGAKVLLRAADAGEFWEGHTLLQDAESDADGYVYFSGVPRSRVRVEANAPRYAAGTIEALEVTGAGEDHEFELPLERGGALTGRVVDTDRRPIVGAKVFLIEQDENQFFWGDYLPPVPDREPDAVSAAGGSFRVEGLPLLAADAKSRSLLIAHAEEVGMGSAKQVRAGEQATITIPRGVRASGTVLTDDGQPLAGADVHLHQETPWGWDDEKATATSAEDGSFALPLVPPGNYDLSVTSSIGGSETMPLDLLRDVEDLRLRVQRDPLLTILVLDPDGQPVPGAHVDAHTPNTKAGGQTFAVDISGDFTESSMGMGWSDSVTADENGRAIFRDPATGEIKIAVRAEGWARLHSSIVSSGGNQEEEVRLERPGALVVLVRDGAGQSVRGVSIRVRDPEREVDAQAQTSDHLGRAVWNDLAPGRWEVSHDAGGAVHQEYFGDLLMIENVVGNEKPDAPPGEAVRIEAAEQTVHEILLEDLAVVTVRVLRGGAPAPDVAVRLEPKTETNSNYYSGWNSGNASGTRTDARGVAVLTPVTAGEYQLIAKSGRNTPETIEEITLQVGPQERTVKLNGAEVRGVLRDLSGPLAGARVTLSKFSPDEKDNSQGHMGFVMFGGSDGAIALEFGEGGGSSSASSGQEGEYLFQDVPEGQWVVKAKRKGVGPWTSLPFTVSGDRPVRVPEHTMLPGAVLHGHDHNWTGPKEESERFNFNWSDSIHVETTDGRRVGMTQPDERGEWRIEDLEEGEYFVKRGSWRSDAIRLSPGERQRQDVPKEEPKAPRGG
ncbi:MAG: carboxypeptidase regulatory-like domain-containing protein [Planctomycetota bacterium]|nr:carboxypeptidase regulatory-like domain-containing protein [Planctomycetota bacterium]